MEGSSMDIVISILLVVIGVIVGIVLVKVLGLFGEKNFIKRQEEMLEKAKKEADKLKRESILEAKEEAHKVKLELEKEKNEKKQEVKELEDRILQREKSMEKREELYQRREEALDEKEERINKKQEDVQNEKVKVEELKEQQIEVLEKISNLSREKAKDMIMKKCEEAMTLELTAYMKERENEAKLEVDKRAKEMLVSSMQKFAADVASEQTVTVVSLPNDDLKGRIIGREGRNIKTIEAITGVDLIIDDTPEAVVLSSFDPFRREIARITLETLLKDGRIHPTRIEEIYDKVETEMNARLTEYGNDALFELGITKVDPELVQILGRLHFRTSYGQNALAHSLEVAHLSGVLA